MLVHAKVDFAKKVLDWDGFGFNYVETAQTTDYHTDPQDYGGFSILDQASREKIIDLVFGENGLKPNIVKMFLDPFHQTAGRVNRPGYGKIDQGLYDHETFTKWMRYFVKEGYGISSKAKRPFEIITTLYGPPAFMTKQKFLGGRDLDPAFREELAKYMTAWAAYLIREEKLPVRYLSIHNEGEDYSRWPEDGSRGNLGAGQDYNLYWPPEAVRDFLPLLKEVLEANQLSDVGVTPGETSNWTRFHNWGYAGEISEDPQAVGALGLITSHGFSGGLVAQRGYGDHRSAGTDMIRAKRPDLHSWVTSTSWSEMDAKFIYQMHENIYCAKNNAIIPWAGIQRPGKWLGGDPNPGNAIQIEDDGTYEVRKGYYYYKQVCPVAQHGMYAAHTYSTDTGTCVLAFASNGTDNPNAFVVVNAADSEAKFRLTVKNGGTDYQAYRTSPSENCAETENLHLDQEHASLVLPPDSVSTYVQI